MRSAQMSEQISISAFDGKAIDIVPLCSYHLQRPANKSQRLRASKSCNHVQIENHMKIHGLDRWFLFFTFLEFCGGGWFWERHTSPCTRPAWMATPFPRNWLRCSSSSPEIANVFATKEVAVRARSAESHGKFDAFCPSADVRRTRTKLSNFTGANDFQPKKSKSWRARLFSSIWNFQPDSFDHGMAGSQMHTDFGELLWTLLWRWRFCPSDFVTLSDGSMAFIPMFWSNMFFLLSFYQKLHHLQCFVPLSWAPPAPFNSYERSNGSCNCSNSWYASLVPTSAFSVKSMPCLKLLCVQKAKSASSLQIASILQAQCPSQIGPG